MEKFNFMISKEWLEILDVPPEDTIYTAELISDDIYKVSWENDEERIDDVTYFKEEVEEFLADSIWIRVN